MKITSVHPVAQVQNLRLYRCLLIYFPDCLQIIFLKGKFDHGAPSVA